MTKVSIAKPDMSNPTIVLGSLMPQGANDYCPKLIGGSIRSIAVTGKKLDARIHATAYAILLRSLPQSDDASMSGHLDCSLAGPLLNAMPRGGRVNALAQWFRKYSNIRPLYDSKKGEWSAKLDKPDSKTFVTVDAQAAWAHPFYEEVTVEGKPLSFDDKALERMIAAICDRAAAVEEEGKLSLSADNLVHLNALRAMRKAA